MDIVYIISQILVVIYYLVYTSTYSLKDKEKILIIGIIATIISSLSYLLLGAYTGVAMCIIAMIRNIYFYKSKNISSLLIILVITIIASILSYQNIYSIFTISATIIYTYGLWQAKTKTYKLLGISVNLLMIIYNISIKSIMGVIFMSLAFITSVIGYIKEGKR